MLKSENSDNQIVQLSDQQHSLEYLITKFLDYLNTKSVPVHQIPGGESGSGGRSGAPWRKSDCTKVRKARLICIVLCRSEYVIRYEK